MISVQKSTIPSYLYESEFFRSLECGEEGEIEVDARCLKLDSSVTNYDDLEHYLSTVRFWGAKGLSNELMDYCFVNPRDAERAAEAFPELQVVRQLAQVVGEKTFNQLLKACEIGNVDIVSYARLRLCEDPYYSEAIENSASQAATFGHVDCLRHLCENGCPRTQGIALAACGNGHFDCLKYTHGVGHPLHPGVTSICARTGRLDILQYLHKHGCPGDTWTTRTAATHNHLHIMQYARDHGAPWSAEVCEKAAEGGHLEVLKYARENGCPWNGATTRAAAEQGHFDCLKYALDHGCGRDASVCEAAAGGGHLQCLLYAHANRSSVSGSAVTGAAAEGGNLACLQFVLRNGARLSDDILGRACRGSVEVVKFLRETHGLQWSQYSAAIALGAGKADVLAYCLQNGAPLKDLSEAGVRVRALWSASRSLLNTASSGAPVPSTGRYKLETLTQ
jgi:hypothetical protein